MTLKVTERDKKLLVVLAVVVIVLGLGVGVLFPLMVKSQELDIRLIEERAVKYASEQKMNTLDTLKESGGKLKEELESLRGEFYEMTPSMEIDRMLTGMAVSHGLVVKELDITSPAAGDYTKLADYQKMLLGRIEASMDEDTASSEEEPEEYTGAYTSRAEISMTGSREALQAMLDACAALEPKVRIAEFLWEKEREDAGGYILTMSVELYMSENADQYVKDNAIQDAVEKASEKKQEEQAK